IFVCLFLYSHRATRALHSFPTRRSSDLLVLKHLSDWTFDECEREVRGSLVYRAFCRIDGERVPDAKTLIRLARLLDEPVLKDVRSEEHTSELQSLRHLVCRLLLEKKKEK